MKIKLVIVDWEIPPRLKKWGLRMGLPLAMLLGGSAAAWAAGLRTWNPGDTLLAADLNGNFASLDARVAALEGPTSKVSLHDVSSFVLPANVDGTQFVVVPYAMKTVDDLTEYGATNNRFTPQKGGDYEICGSLSSSANGPTFELDAFVNGARDRAFAVSNDDTATPLGGGCVTIRLNSGDYVEVRALQLGSFDATILTDPNWDWMTVSKIP